MKRKTRAETKSKLVMMNGQIPTQTQPTAIPNLLQRKFAKDMKFQIVTMTMTMMMTMPMLMMKMAIAMTAMMMTKIKRRRIKNRRLLQIRNLLTQNQPTHSLQSQRTNN